MQVLESSYGGGRYVLADKRITSITTELHFCSITIPLALFWKQKTLKTLLGEIICIYLEERHSSTSVKEGK